VFNQDLQTEIAQNTNGDFEVILSTILSGNRSDLPPDNNTIALGTSILRDVNFTCINMRRINVISNYFSTLTNKGI